MDDGTTKILTATVSIITMREDLQRADPFIQRRLRIQSGTSMWMTWKCAVVDIPSEAVKADHMRSTHNVAGRAGEALSRIY